MHKYRAGVLLIVLTLASMLVGYEIGSNQHICAHTPTSLAQDRPDAKQSIDEGPTAAIGREAHEAAERTDSLTAQLVFGAQHLSMESALARLGRFALSSINVANVLALLGSIFFVATLLMRTIVPLRISAIFSDVFFVGYAVLAHSVTTFILYNLLLPINLIRLYQMVKLIRKARASAHGDLSMDWLKPFMIRRKYRKNQMLFHKGDAAKEMLYVVTGKFCVTEIGVELGAGRILGELGFLSPKNRRTQTVKCIEEGEVLTITYDKLLEIYFQNPDFGYYFLRLSSERLLENIARLEAVIEQNKTKLPA